MIWIIIFVLCLALVAWGGNSSYDAEFQFIIGVLGIILLGVVIAVQASSVCTADLWLSEERTEIIKLRAGIAEVKASIYDSKRGQIFDAQNMSQSTKLSEYTGEVLKREAKFNKDLLSYKNALNSTTSFWVGRRIYIPDAVKSIEGF